MKKKFLVMLCGVMMLSATACGSSANSSASSAASTSAASAVESTVSSEAAVSETEAASEADTSDVDPDLKAFLDSYEETMNEYCDFMETYVTASEEEQADMVTDYNDILTKYTEFAASAESYQQSESEMSEADLAYYEEVTARVNERLNALAELAQ